MADKEIKIKYDEIFSIIKDNFNEVINGANKDIYGNYNIVISMEQQFIRDGEMNPNNIYIVVRFGSADVEFGQTVLPVTLKAISEEDSCTVCQMLFEEMAETYTLERASDDEIRQVYQSPSVDYNFQNVYSGFRSVLSTTAFFVITKDINYYRMYYYPNYPSLEGKEEIECLNSSFGGNTSLDPQVFYNSDNFSKSQSRFGSRTLNFVTYLLSNNELIKKAIEIYFSDNGEIGKTNNDFYIGIKFKKTDLEFIKPYKLASADIQQQISSIPLITITFSN